MATSPVPVKSVAPAPVGTSDPWRSLRAEMDRLFDRFALGFTLPSFPALRYETAAALPTPAVDIVEDNAGFKLTAELPGLTEKDVQVASSGDTLTITGEKRQEREEKDKGYHLTERSYGQFRRSFVVPEGVDRDKIAAEFANGVLTVTLPKVVTAAPKKIEVKAAA